MDGFSQGVKGLLQDCKADIELMPDACQPLMSRKLSYNRPLRSGVIHALYYWWGENKFREAK